MFYWKNQSLSSIEIYHLKTYVNSLESLPYLDYGNYLDLYNLFNEFFQDI